MPDRTNLTAARDRAWQEMWRDQPDPNAHRVLVVPDLHQRVDHADYWYRQEYDLVIYLGDVFDSQDDETEETVRMATWVKERLYDSKCVFLMGNHEGHYRWNWESLIYPGFTPDKAAAINEILDTGDWARMRLACMAGNYLCSHAGFSPIWVKPPTVEHILARCKLAEDRAAQGIVDPVFGYGELPGGAQKFGGPLAMAWDFFVPIDGVHQIVGHTAGDDVRVKAGTSSINVCLDVGNGAVAAMVRGSHVEILHIPSQELGPLRR